MTRKIRIEYKIEHGETSGKRGKTIKTDMMYLFLEGKYFLFYTGEHRKDFKRQSWLFRFIKHLPIKDWIGVYKDDEESRKLRMIRDDKKKTILKGYKELYISKYMAKKLLTEVKNPEVIKDGELNYM